MVAPARTAWSVDPATNQTIALMAGGRAINGTSPANNDTFTIQATFAATWDLNSAAFIALSTLCCETRRNTPVWMSVTTT